MSQSCWTDVEEVDELDRVRKMLAGYVPDPFGAIADDGFLFLGSSHVSKLLPTDACRSVQPF